jgi:hypothetical protein
MCSLCGGCRSFLDRIGRRLAHRRCRVFVE